MHAASFVRGKNLGGMESLERKIGYPIIGLKAILFVSFHCVFKDSCGSV